MSSGESYGIGPAAKSTNTGEDYSHDGKSSVLHADGSVTGPDGDIVFDPSKDAVEYKTPKFGEKGARVVIDKDAHVDNVQESHTGKKSSKKDDDQPVSTADESNVVVGAAPAVADDDKDAK